MSNFENTSAINPNCTRTRAINVVNTTSLSHKIGHSCKETRRLEAFAWDASMIVRFTNYLPGWPSSINKMFCAMRLTKHFVNRTRLFTGPACQNVCRSNTSVHRAGVSNTVWHAGPDIDNDKLSLSIERVCSQGQRVRTRLFAGPAC